MHYWRCASQAMIVLDSRIVTLLHSCNIPIYLYIFFSLSLTITNFIAHHR